MDRETFQIFKQQLYEFIEFKDSPFTVDFLYMSCNKPIEKSNIIDALSELEEEGKIIRLWDGSYLSAKVAWKKWIKKLYEEIEIPSELYDEIKKLIEHIGIFKSVEEFVKKALETFIQTVKPQNRIKFKRS